VANHEALTMSTLVPLLAALSVAACGAVRPVQPPIACEGFAPAPISLEQVGLWETSRLGDRTPLSPRVEGVRFAVRPEASRAAVERTLRCGLGPVGQVLAREGVTDVAVYEAGPALEVRARTASLAGAERLVRELVAR
jgi:hypothetical protein